jgi:outer membrane receptor for ferrienterochelin and colicin
MVRQGLRALRKGAIGMSASSRFLFFLLVLGACQWAPGGAGRAPSSRNAITEEELNSLPPSNVFQAVQRLRPAWLRGRVTTVRGASGERYYAQVFVDGMPRGDLDVLNGMDIRDVQEIRYQSAPDATTRFGTGYPGGIIEIVTKRGGGGLCGSHGS